jgi:hypothetical protein
MNKPLNPHLRQTNVIGSALSPSDFRIGNYLQSKQWGGIGQIEGIEVFENHFEIKSKGYIHKYEKDKYFDLSPVEITTELLLKMGFVEDNRFIVLAIFGVRFSGAKVKNRYLRITE